MFQFSRSHWRCSPRSIYSRIRDIGHPLVKARCALCPSGIYSLSPYRSIPFSLSSSPSTRSSSITHIHISSSLSTPIPSAILSFVVTHMGRASSQHPSLLNVGMWDYSGNDCQPVDDDPAAPLKLETLRQNGTVDFIHDTINICGSTGYDLNCSTIFSFFK